MIPNFDAMLSNLTPSLMKKFQTAYLIWALRRWCSLKDLRAPSHSYDESTTSFAFASHISLLRYSLHMSFFRLAFRSWDELGHLNCTPPHLPLALWMYLLRQFYPRSWIFPLIPHPALHHWTLLLPYLLHSKIFGTSLFFTRDFLFLSLFSQSGLSQPLPARTVSVLKRF